jgi:hypothetical protein
MAFSVHWVKLGIRLRDIAYGSMLSVSHSFFKVPSIGSALSSVNKVKSPIISRAVRLNPVNNCSIWGLFKLARTTLESTSKETSDR